MPAADFGKVLDLPDCKGALSLDGEQFAYPCGLGIGVVSTKDIRPSSYVLQYRRPWSAAHTRHHAAGHKPSGVSIYFSTRPNDEGQPRVIEAQCSCRYDPDA